MNKIDYIREEEKRYHEHCYDNYKLFEEGSWLHKPVKTVMDLFSCCDGNGGLMVLDLGCGVGRNSIPMAEKVKEKKGQVICVDLLETALSKLMAYSKEYGVEKYIKPVRCDIGEYAIFPNQFDVIIAVSSLEHVKSKETLNKVLVDMANGTKDDGIYCIILNTNVKETDLVTNQSLEPLIEVNMTTEQSWELLLSIYFDWEQINSHVKPLKFEINRDGKLILLSSDCITLVVKKKPALR